MAKLTVEVEVMHIEISAVTKVIVNGQSHHQKYLIECVTKDLWDELSKKMDKIK